MKARNSSDATLHEAVLRIANAVAPIGYDEFRPVLKNIRYSAHPENQLIIKRGASYPGEMFVLEGIVRTYLTDAEGREVTINLHVGPCTFTPSIGREFANLSRVDCASLTQVQVARFSSKELIKCMVESTRVQHWGDTVLRNELLRRADREWALAALPGIERLQLFRKSFPGLEELIPHHYIASYLGMTAVTLSRLRSHLGGTAVSL